MADDVRVAIGTDADVVTARQQARAVARSSASRHGPDAARDGDLRDRAQHHGLRGGASSCSRRHDGGRRGIEVVARDEGPGIADVELALQDGYTTGVGLGLGLPGARRLVDEFDIVSAPGAGPRSHS